MVVLWVFLSCFHIFLWVFQWVFQWVFLWFSYGLSFGLSYGPPSRPLGTRKFLPGEPEVGALPGIPKAAVVITQTTQEDQAVLAAAAGAIAGRCHPQ